MPTILGPRFLPTFLGSPPRMSLEDFEIWRRWWPSVTGQTVALYFDVGLGIPRNLPFTVDVNQAYGWLRNNQKRADVIVERSDEVWLVELRFRAQSNAIGRLLTYQDLLAQDNPFQKAVRLFLVTDFEDPEVRATAERLGIIYVVVVP